MPTPQGPSEWAMARAKEIITFLYDKWGKGEPFDREKVIALALDSACAEGVKDERERAAKAIEALVIVDQDEYRAKMDAGELKGKCVYVHGGKGVGKTARAFMETAIAAIRAGDTPKPAPTREAGCDCESPDTNPALVSAECPVHNLYPTPKPAPAEPYPATSMDEDGKVTFTGEPAAPKLPNGVLPAGLFIGGPKMPPAEPHTCENCGGWIFLTGCRENGRCYQADRWTPKRAEEPKP